MLSYFLEHPVFVLSLATLMCSAVGYWGEYLLLSTFGINVVFYAEINDFLLAAFRNPWAFLFGVPLFALVITWWSDFFDFYPSWRESIKEDETEVSRELKQAKSENDTLNTALLKREKAELAVEWKDFRAYRRTDLKQCVAMTLVATTVVVGWLYVDLMERVEHIFKSPTTRAVIVLKTGEMLPNGDNPSPLVFITATGKFMFFHQNGEELGEYTIVLPTTSVSSVTYVPLDSEENVPSVEHN